MPPSSLDARIIKKLLAPVSASGEKHLLWPTQITLNSHPPDPNRSNLTSAIHQSLKTGQVKVTNATTNQTRTCVTRADASGLQLGNGFQKAISALGMEFP